MTWVISDFQLPIVDLIPNGGAGFRLRRNALETPVFFELAIANRQLAMSGWLADPGCSLFLKGSNFGSVGDVALRPPERNGAVAGHVFKCSHRPLTGFVSFQTVRHFDPFGTELL